MARHRLAPVMLVGLLGACHHADGTHVADMSRAGHDAAAVEAEREAAEQQAQYDPLAVEAERSRCDTLCFVWFETEEHLAEARRLRAVADRHRRASEQLRVTEVRACADIPVRDRDISPFFHREHIMGVELAEAGPIVVHFDAIPKTTAASFQHLVDCHLARNATMGFAMEDMAYCPLAVAGTRATVVEVEGGFDIQLEPQDDTARADIRARVEKLRP